jgi:hypothetical protein
MSFAGTVSAELDGPVIKGRPEDFKPWSTPCQLSPMPIAQRDATINACAQPQEDFNQSSQLAHLVQNVTRNAMAVAREEDSNP